MIGKRKQYISSDNSFFNRFDKKTIIQLKIRNDHWIEINKYLRYLRLEEYYYNEIGIFKNFYAYFWARKKNKLGLKLGFFIPANTVGTGVTIYHNGNIIINGDAQIGRNCTFHGMNCVGNNGKNSEAPVIGNNVDIGIGAKIIGGVRIADNVKIGANAVVTRNCLTPGAVLAGVPAVEINKSK